MFSKFFSAGLISALCLTAWSADAEFRTLEGTVNYRERIALPSDAVINVQLVDISLADAPSVLLGAVALRPSGQVPIDWRLTYDDGMLSSRHRFAIQANVTLGGRVLFRTEQVFPALSMNAPEKVDVTLVKATAPKPKPLMGTAWIATEMVGIDTVAGRIPDIVFAENARVSGTGGCNRFSGRYELLENKIRLGPLATTRMACTDAVSKQEQTVLQLLGQVRSYDITGNILVMKNDVDDVLVRWVVMH